MKKYLGHHLPKSGVQGSTSMKPFYEKKYLEKYSRQSIHFGGTKCSCSEFQ